MYKLCRNNSTPMQWRTTKNSSMIKCYRMISCDGQILKITVNIYFHMRKMLFIFSPKYNVALHEIWCCRLAVNWAAV